MFGGPPPQQTPAEIKQQEQEATATLQWVAMGAILLFLSPFAVDSIKKLV